MKSLLVFIVLFFFSIGISAQNLTFEIPTDAYLPIGIGMSFYQSKDAFNSPNRHRGLTSKFLLGYESFSAEEIHRESVSFHSGSLSNGTKNGGKLNLFQSVYRGEYGVRNQPINIVAPDLTNQVNYFVGLSLKVNFSSRSGGKLFQFDGAATLALNAQATYNFYDFQFEDENWFYDASVSLPLIGVGFRPRYASPAYEGAIPSRKKQTIGLVHIGNHFDLDARFNANWNMGNGNLLRGTYRWWWYDSRLMHRVRMVENGLDFSLMTKLN